MLAPWPGPSIEIICRCGEVPDARDRRAKLVVPTERSRQALQDAAVRVAEIEHRWGTIVGHDRFDDACYVLSSLLDELTPEDR